MATDPTVPTATGLGFDVPANPDAPAPGGPGQVFSSNAAGLGFDVPQQSDAVGTTGGRIGGDLGYEPYFNPSTRRPSNEWAKPNLALTGQKNFPGVMPGPFAPQEQDFGNIRLRSGLALGQWGSRPVGLGATAMLQYGGKAADEYVKGQVMRANYDNQLYELANKKLIDRQVQESEAYGEAYTIFNEHKDPDRLRSELMRLTYAFDDPPMRTALANGGFEGGHALQQYRDSHLLPLLQIEEQRAEIAAALDKAGGGAKERALEAPMMDTGASDASQQAIPGEDAPATAGAAAGGQATSPGGTQTPAQQAVPAPESWQPVTPPSETAAPAVPNTTAPDDLPDSSAPQQPNEPMIGLPPLTQAAPSRGVQVASSDPNFIPQEIADANNVNQTDQTGQPAPSQTFSDYSKAIDDQINTSLARHPGWKNRALLRDDAERLLLGDPKITPSTVGREVFAEANAVAGMMHHAIDGITDRARKGGYGTDPAERRTKTLADVDKITPLLRQWITGLIDGTSTPPSGWAEGRPPWNMAVPLAFAIEPGMDLNSFRTRGSTLRSFASGVDGRNVTALGTTYLHANDMVKDLMQLRAFEAGRTGAGAEFREWAGTHKWIAGASGTTPQEQALFQKLDQSTKIVADEFSKAVHGTGTVSGRETEEALLNWRDRPLEGLISMVQETMFPQLRARMEMQRVRFQQGTGRDQMEEMFRIYEQQGKVIPGTAAAIHDLTTTGSDMPLPSGPPAPGSIINVTPDQLRQFQ